MRMGWLLLPFLLWDAQRSNLPQTDKVSEQDISSKTTPPHHTVQQQPANSAPLPSPA